MVTKKTTELNAFAQRFNEALDHIGVPPKGKNRQALVGKMFGVSQEAAGKWLNGKSMPETHRIPGIVKKLRVSVDWFVYGDVTKGPAWIGSGQVSDEQSEYPVHSDVIFWDSIEDLPEGEYVAVPRLNIKLAAGNGRLNGDWPTEERKLAYRTDWIKTASKARSTRLIVVDIDGNSMSPTLSDGDLALVDLSQNAITNGLVYAYRHHGQVCVKRLYKQGDKIIIHSDNNIDPKYRIDQEVVGDEMNSIEIVGRVVHRQGSGGL